MKLRGNGRPICLTSLQNSYSIVRYREDQYNKYSDETGCTTLYHIRIPNLELREEGADTVPVEYFWRIASGRMVWTNSRRIARQWGFSMATACRKGDGSRGNTRPVHAFIHVLLLASSAKPREDVQTAMDEHLGLYTNAKNRNKQTRKDAPVLHLQLCTNQFRQCIVHIQNVCTTASLRMHIPNLVYVVKAGHSPKGVVGICLFHLDISQGLVGLGGE